MHPKDIFIGSTHGTNAFGTVVVIEYKTAWKVTVRFVDTGYKTVVTTSQIRAGNIKDKLMPSVMGVGFVGVGKYKATINGKVTKQHSAWTSMMARCYSEKCHISRPTYIGCSVCSEWHNFQNFAEWFDRKYIDGTQLDKDTIIDGNKVYSPLTCAFISIQENTIKAHAMHYRFKNPSGELVEIYNLNSFCKKNELMPQHMGKVHHGKRMSHKGWTKA